MVKFSKELEAQLIPEWKDAFVNYWQLKKHVKKIKLSRSNKQAASSHDHLNHENLGRSIFDPVRFVAMKVASCSSKLFLGSSNNNTNEIIQVTRAAKMGSHRFLHFFSDFDVKPVKVFHSENGGFLGFTVNLLETTLA